MAREARKLSKSGNYYITLRGTELFVTDEDRQKFAEILEKNFATGIVHGYELTKTEIRLVVKEGEKGISMTMKPVTTSYARYFNRVHEREGKLFSDRFKSKPLETKSEIEERIANLKDVADNNASGQAKKASKPDKIKTLKKPAAQKDKNLPSWLL